MDAAARCAAALMVPALRSLFSRAGDQVEQIDAKWSMV
jgi:hypothetical protein